MHFSVRVDCAIRGGVTITNNIADFPQKQLTRVTVLEGRSMSRLDRTAQETGHVKVLD